MALVKLAFVGLCVFLCLSLTSANTNGASSSSINGDGDDDPRSPKLIFSNSHRASSKSFNGGDGDDVPLLPKMMPSGTGKQQSSGSAHLRGNGVAFGHGHYNMVGSYQNPNGPVNVVEYPCPGYGYVCSPSPCYQSPPSYGCQPCNQVNMAQKVNMKNGAQGSPKEATETMPRAPNNQ